MSFWPPGLPRDPPGSLRWSREWSFCPCYVFFSSTPLSISPSSSLMLFNLSGISRGAQVCSERLTFSRAGDLFSLEPWGEGRPAVHAGRGVPLQRRHTPLAPGQHPGASVRSPTALTGDSAPRPPPPPPGSGLPAPRPSAPPPAPASRKLPVIPQHSLGLSHAGL